MTKASPKLSGEAWIIFWFFQKYTVSAHLQGKESRR